MLLSFKIDNNDKYTSNLPEQENTNTMDMITEQGRKELRDKINALIKQKPVVAERISAARDQGGLEENEELHMALEEMQRLDVEIQRLNSIAESSTIITSKPKGEYDKVEIGMYVELENLNNERKMTYQLLGEVESNPSLGIISYKSPLGREILGLNVGEIAELIRGDDVVEYEILRVYSK